MQTKVDELVNIIQGSQQPFKPWDSVGFVIFVLHMVDHFVIVRASVKRPRIIVLDRYMRKGLEHRKENIELFRQQLEKAYDQAGFLTDLHPEIEVYYGYPEAVP